jgi:hypothetical protein
MRGAAQEVLMPLACNRSSSQWLAVPALPSTFLYAMFMHQQKAQATKRHALHPTCFNPHNVVILHYIVLIFLQGVAWIGAAAVCSGSIQAGVPWCSRTPPGLWPALPPATQQHLLAMQL